MRNEPLYIGQYVHSIDSKNRLFIPSRFRTNSKYFIITRGLEGCLFLYDINGWEKVLNKLEELSVNNKMQQRAFKRALLSGANEVKPDSQGRILIPQNLVEYSKITSEVIIIGVGNRLEIWNKKRWEAYYQKQANISYKTLASKLEI